MTELNEAIHGLATRTWNNKNLEQFLIHLNKVWGSRSRLESHELVRGDQFNEYLRAHTEKELLHGFHVKLMSEDLTALIVEGPTWFHVPVDISSDEIEKMGDLPRGYPESHEMGICWIEAIAVPIYRK